jgi:hypothetical protein
LSGNEKDMICIKCLLLSCSMWNAFVVGGKIVLLGRICMNGTLLANSIMQCSVTDRLTNIDLFNKYHNNFTCCFENRHVWVENGFESFIYQKLNIIYDLTSETSEFNGCDLLTNSCFRCACCLFWVSKFAYRTSKKQQLMLNCHSDVRSNSYYVRFV